MGNITLGSHTPYFLVVRTTGTKDRKAPALSAEYWHPTHRAWETSVWPSLPALVEHFEEQAAFKCVQIAEVRESAEYELVFIGFRSYFDRPTEEQLRQWARRTGLEEPAV